MKKTRQLLAAAKFYFRFVFHAPFLHGFVMKYTGQQAEFSSNMPPPEPVATSSLSV
jgi:hypothetical protein